MRPRPISGSAGSRIKVILGDTGSDYLLLLDEDNGNHECQRNDWTAGYGSLPAGLANQLNNLPKKGRYADQVAFGPNGAWYVSGVKRDGSGSHAWWGGGDIQMMGAMKEYAGNGSSVQVSFGKDGEYAIIIGTNGYATSCSFNNDLLARIQRMRNRSMTIKKVCLFPAGGYFISDDEGTEWQVGNTHLSKELKNGRDTVLDVIKAGDGSWIVIRPNRYVASQGVCSELTTALTNFYSRHQRQQQTRAKEIAAYDAQVRELQRKERQAAEASRLEREAAERRAKEAEEAARLEREIVERRVKEAEEAARLRRKAAEAARVKEERAKTRRDEQQRIEQIQNKRLKTGERVTVLGLSEEPGDSIVTSVGNKGELKIQHSPDSRTLVIRDPRKLVAYDEDEEDVDIVNLLCFAEDKYESAVALYHCKCSDGICQCKKVVSAYTNKQSPPAVFQMGERVHVTDFADAVIIPKEVGAHVSGERLRVRYDDGTSYYVRKDHLEKLGQALANSLFTSTIQEQMYARPLLEHRGEVQRFDEYKCAEKIDLRALKRLMENLETDSSSRRDCMERLERWSFRTQRDEEALKKLQRCQVLELTVQDLYDLLKDVLADENGYVVHEVMYEHRDTSYRGRLFAKGRKIHFKSADRYPRTSTLQGMHSDLRPLLVGKFAHDIDCENSEIRLVCSLASQLGLEALIPTIVDYRDNRKNWLERIADQHGVSEAEAKRLPNIILSGGRYETWLRAMGVDETHRSLRRKEVKAFVFKLYSEMHAIRDQLLTHGRFQWTSIERERLKKDGKSDGAIDSMLMPRIVQSCENEVLGIIHRCFEDQGWRVRAKVFDGLIAENHSRRMELLLVMRKAESACFSRGWDIRLVEKPLHGLQNEPLKTVQEARAEVARLTGQSW